MEHKEKQSRLTHRDYCAIYEQYLKRHNFPYVAVDDAKRQLFGNVRLESFDYVVYHEDMPNGLVVVVGDLLKRQTVAKEKIEGLKQWEDVFGEGFSGAFAFISASRLSDRAMGESKHTYSIDYIWLREYERGLRGDSSIIKYKPQEELPKISEFRVGEQFVLP